MLSLASKVARATRVLFAETEDSLWTISANTRVVGSLVCEAGRWRLSWFAGADRRLVDYAGPVSGDIETLERALGLRLGAPVHFESHPV
ncbi:MAG: hypothetical protein JSR47_01345 [Proteobacteria bacterium]|nr:hypothetical protein [Pseudomonadota bacterium]